MATWTTTQTTTDDPSPTKIQTFKDNFLGLLFRLIRFVVIVVALMAELFSVTKVVNTQANPAEIRQEIDRLIQNGATQELILDPIGDMEIHDALMTWVRTMRNADWVLEKENAQNLWKTISGKNDGTTLEYIEFDHEQNRVLLRYTAGITAEVVMEFNGNYISKAVTLRQGVFNGDIFRWIYWNLIGRFLTGYPRYVMEAPITGSGLQSGDMTFTKYSVRNQVFSWSWNPKSKQANESVSEHQWT